MNTQEIISLLKEIQFNDYRFALFDTMDKGLFLQAWYEDEDIVTGKLEVQKTRKWLLSSYMTKSEIVQTAFKCCMTSMEHRTREAFKYKGKRIFGPHFDVDALWKISSEGAHDYRPELEAK